MIKQPHLALIAYSQWTDIDPMLTANIHQFNFGLYQSQSYKINAAEPNPYIWFSQIGREWAKNPTIHTLNQQANPSGGPYLHQRGRTYAEDTLSIRRAKWRSKWTHKLTGKEKIFDAWIGIDLACTRILITCFVSLYLHYFTAAISQSGPIWTQLVLPLFWYICCSVSL